MNSRIAVILGDRSLTTGSSGSTFCSDLEERLDDLDPEPARAFPFPFDFEEEAVGDCIVCML